ncbi:MAG TPA: D-TA family PLP-dependent enzyme [Chloroflexia bacterium]|jgi:D-serine deaminase-like pyridoxal phosphate-dependent protein
MTRISELDTPALLVDYKRMQRNIAAMQAMCDANGVALRPHTKTHKSPAVARLQVEAGARGITVAKVGEAEVMVEAGFDDLFIAYPLIGESKYRRLLPLLERARIAVAADSPEGVAQMSAFFGPLGANLPVLVEIDTGFRRTGVADAEAAVALAQVIARAPGLTFAGLMEFSGYSYAACSEAERRAVGHSEAAPLLEAAERLGKMGLSAGVISTGSTPSMPFVAETPGVTEVRPGVYVFGDLKQAELGTLRRDECALTVLATVVSTPAPGRYILDSGTKALSSDHYATWTYGELKEYPGAVVTRASEEHGIIEGTSLPLRVGDRVEVIPNHACATCNMHDEFFLIDGDTVLDVWPVLGRGKFR